LAWASIEATSGELIERLTLDFRLGLSGRPFLRRMGVDVPELYGDVELIEDGTLISGLGTAGEERNGDEAERTTGDVVRRASGMTRGGRGAADRSGEGERTGNGTTGRLVIIVSLGLGAASPTGVGGKSASVSVSVSASSSARREVFAL
jgi:hypothetical protein